MLNNINSKVIRLFKSGVVNLEGKNPLNKSKNDIAYISPEDLLTLGKKFSGTHIFRNGHFDDDVENHTEEVVGKLGDDVWVEGDWVMGTAILMEEGKNQLTNGYGVSISYEIKQGIENKKSDKKEGIIYDYRILDIEPNHIAIVKNPRYEGAGLKHNSLHSNDKFLTCEHHFKNNLSNINLILDNEENIVKEGITEINKNMSFFIKNKSERKNNNSQDPENEKKYASLDGKKVRGMDAMDFKNRVTEMYSKKHNEFEETEDNLESIISIEHEGREIEMTMREALELIALGEKVEDKLENEGSVDKEVEIEYERKDNAQNEEKKKAMPIKKQEEKKHNSYIETLKANARDNAPKSTKTFAIQELLNNFK